MENRERILLIPAKEIIRGDKVIITTPSYTLSQADVVDEKQSFEVTQSQAITNVFLVKDIAPITETSKYVLTFIDLNSENPDTDAAIIDDEMIFVQREIAVEEEKKQKE